MTTRNQKKSWCGRARCACRNRRLVLPVNRFGTHSVPYVALLILLATSPAWADPCGMVPPYWQGPGSPIVRVDLQKTYVFYKDGVETFAIRPGFSGKVEEFGMLIPFPTPPAIRKVPDEIFAHLAAAVDPPEVIVDLRPPLPNEGVAFGARKSSSSKDAERDLKYDTVRVIRQEAIGMYEVAVLEAGSAAALKKWMDEHGFRYPTGMDRVCEEYINMGWCFVAEKTRVGQKAGIEPRPGQRSVDSKLPAGATFDGFVQGMAFRFKTDKFTVPMRLSAYNEGPMRNIVYLLTDKPRRIASMPESFVVRQLPGADVFRNVTQPLPLRIIGGEQKGIPERRLKTLPKERDPAPHNGVARDLFAADLQAVKTGQLALAHEESEKVLLSIGERLLLRGPQIDALHAEALAEERKKTVTAALDDIKNLTLTVIDGDFPRQIVARQNLTFPEYTMASLRNSPSKYDAKHLGPAPALPGVRVGFWQRHRDWLGLALASGIAAVGYVWLRRGGRGRTIWRVGVVLAIAAAGLYAGLARAEHGPVGADRRDKPGGSLRELVAALADAQNAERAVTMLVARGNDAVPLLCGEAVEGTALPQRGWAIAALAEIGSPGVDEFLQKLHEDTRQPPLVRTWAAAGRVRVARNSTELIERVPLVANFPALGRPLAMRLAALAGDKEKAPAAETLLVTAAKYPQLHASLSPMILSLGPKSLAKALTTARDDTARYQAAAFLGTLAGQGDKAVSGELCKAYAFDADAKNVPWAGGALYVPGLAWSKEDAHTLVGHLIAWHLWCERREAAGVNPAARDERRKVQNNLASVGLAQMAGYQIPGFGDEASVRWLAAWGNVVGRKEILRILKEQGVEKDAKYSIVFRMISAKDSPPQ
jgi:hypothetical protein